MTRRQAEVFALLKAMPADTAALTRALEFTTTSAAGAMLLTLFVHGWVDRTRLVRGGPYLYSVTPKGRADLDAFLRPAVRGLRSDESVSGESAPVTA